MIYFDHNATTPLDERVLAAMMPFLTQFYGNPSSLYRHGRIARSAIDIARGQVAALVGVQPGQVIFTSGGTEANNLALNVVKSKLVISAIEHPSVAEPAANLVEKGCQLQVLGVDQQGVVQAEALDSVVAFKPDLVSVMLANNETGVIQDIAGMTEKLKSVDCLVHTDAVQALGKIPVNFAGLGVDMMSLSSHKIYGPKGCGGLVVGKGGRLGAVILGGGQERNYRAGTENVAAIVGFGKAAELAGAELAQNMAHLKQLRHELEQQLMGVPGVTIFAQDTHRLPNTVQFGIDGADGEMLLMKLDKQGIAVSSGSACASGGGKSSPVLAAMGIAQDLAKSAIRVSVGKNNAKPEINQFIMQLRELLPH